MGNTILLVVKMLRVYSPFGCHIGNFDVCLHDQPLKLFRPSKMQDPMQQAARVTQLSQSAVHTGQTAGNGGTLALERCWAA